MIAVIQRVNWAQIRINKRLHAEIGQGILALIGIDKSDNPALADKLLDKILSLRIFADPDERMNLDIKDVGGDLLLVSQFTLVASTNKGLRPSFSSAMPPLEAEKLYNHMVESAERKHDFVRSGRFAADMQIQLENDGPVTFVLTP
ncbi:MAG: hypothetical protein RLZZ385_2536 [Pseudomonadota bacterium]|jgi:D-tyrosyl-tRNA(Tyr) deacylase